MVYCCVPRCPSGKKLLPNVSFHTFPSNPDIAARWVKNINLFIPNGGTWFPQPGDLVCSKHFLQRDFKRETTSPPSLKPHSVPSLFEKTVSFDHSAETNIAKRKRDEPKSPLIVKVLKPEVEDDDDSEMDDEPLTFLREREHSALANSTFPSKSNSPVHVTNLTETCKSGHKPNSLVHPSCSGVVSNIVNSQDTSQSSVISERVQDVHQSAEDLRKANTNQGSKSVELKIKKQKVAVKRQKKEASTDLIEIGPSTFLKINPEVIKVTKKVTQSGNTVLQFLMNPKLGLDAKSIFQPVSNIQAENSSNNISSEAPPKESGVAEAKGMEVSQVNGEKSVESADNLANDAELIVHDTTSNDIVRQMYESSPAILSTTLPVNHSFGLTWKQRHASAMRQKNRQIHALKGKLDKLMKKVDELETKCIVQERQLDFPSLKKLKAIKKNADKGEPHASFILEQIRGYFGNVPLRWSDSTMTQCSIWCRKAPYAYEYFKKADLFRLPCLGTVKRYIKKHPEITTQIKNRTLGVRTLDSDDDSSSDFDFDEDDDDVPVDEDSNDNMNGNVSCEVILAENSTFPSEDSEAVNMIVPDSVPTKRSGVNFVPPGTTTSFSQSNTPLSSKQNDSLMKSDPTEGAENSNEELAVNGTSETAVTEECDTKPPIDETNDEEESSVMEVESSSENIIVKTISNNQVKSIYLPTTTREGHITTMNLNGQEIILQPGNIIQVNSSSADGEENQFFVIPSTDEHASGDHQYSIAQPVSFVIQNADHPEQVIYITETASDSP